MVNKKNLLLSLICLFLLGSIGLSFNLKKQIETFAQTTPTEPTPTSGLNCSLIGNNTAAPLIGSMNAPLNEAKHLLVSFQGNANISDQVRIFGDTIKNSPNTEIIIRLGAGGGDMGPDEATYIQAIKDINTAAGGLPFTVMVSHNEWNCAEHPVNITGSTGYQQELGFARNVVNGLSSLGNIKLISGQVDHLCDPTAYEPTDKFTPEQYVRAFAGIAELDGISLPFYTADASPNGDPTTALSLFSNAVSWASGKEIYITESGPFKRGAATPSEEEVANYVIGIQGVIQNTTNLQALLLFNAYGINTEANFKYTSVFWSPLCRAALRAHCGNVENVLTFCKGGFVDTGEHLCKDFCVGDSHYPCRQTPGNDCSYPMDFDKILDPKYSPKLDQETPIEYGIALRYLRSYLPKTRAGTGKTYQFNAFFKDFQICQEGNPKQVNSLVIDSLCKNITGTGAIQFDLSEEEITGVTPPSQMDGYTLRNQYSTGFFSNRVIDRKDENIDFFEAGFGDKLTFPDERITKISAILALKEDCFLKGYQPIPEYQTNNVFGEVRCMNYQQHPTIQYNSTPINERDLFFDSYGWGVGATDLRICRDVYADPSPRNIKRCKNGLDKLYTQNREVWEWVDQIPNEPKATFAIYGGIDEYASNLEEINGQTNEEASKSGLQSLDGLFLTKDASGCDTLGCLGTSYYTTYPLPAGADTEIAARFTVSKLMFQDKLAISKSLIDSIKSIIGGITGVLDFFDKNNAFNIGRIPVAQQGDARYRALQYALSKQFDACKQNLKNKEIDYSTNVQELRSDKTLVETTYNTESADFLTLVKQLLNKYFEPSADEFPLSNFIHCELFPEGLVIADEYAKSYTSMITHPSEDNLELVRDRTKKRLGSSERKSTSELEIRSEFQCVCHSQPPDDTSPTWPPSCHISGEYDQDGCQEPDTGITGTLEDQYQDATNPTNYSSNDGGQPLLSALKTGAQENFIFEEDTCSLEPGSRNEFYCCSLEREGYDYDPRGICTNLPSKPPTGSKGNVGQVCSISGGFKIENKNLTNLIGQISKSYDIPVELMMTVLWGENCRSTSLYGGKTATICDDSSQDHQGFLEPRALWPYTARCDGRGNPDIGAGVLQANIYFVQGYYSPYKSGSKAVEVCSIYDSLAGAGEFFAERADLFNKKTASDWSIDDMKKAMFYWVRGDGSISSCDDPDDTLGAASLYCGVLERLVEGQSNYQGDRVPTLTQIETTCN